MNNRREFLMQAKKAKGTEDISGWYWSEKLDGMRCLWDGGVSRGLQIGEVPWANLGKGDVAISTGLWSRYGNPIYAPDWFLNALPVCPLDGELHCGRGKFQQTMSAVRKKIPIDDEWREVQYKVFSTPQMQNLFSSGKINLTNFEHYIFMDQCEAFYADYASDDLHHLMTVNGANVSFTSELEYLQLWLEESDPSIVSLHCQLKLPNNPEQAWEIANQRTKNVVQEGGEGGVLRNPEAHWFPKRVNDVLKMKPCEDDEAVVVGGTSGKKGKTGKLHGLVGNLILTYKGKRLELSGFTDEEREIVCPELKEWALKNPGKEFPAEMLKPGALRHFNTGDLITFTYRELSRDGVPKEARYLRPRPEGT